MSYLETLDADPSAKGQTETENDEPLDEELPPLYGGEPNLNPPGIGFLSLLGEDLRTHNNKAFEPGFRSITIHCFGNRRTGFRLKVIRAPLTVAYRVISRMVEFITGIHLPYPVRLGRRVRISHHGGIVFHPKSIGDDVHILRNTTFGVASREQFLAISTIGDRVDIGCDVCILCNVKVGHDSIIGANAVIVSDLPRCSTAIEIPARVIKRFLPEDSQL